MAPRRDPVARILDALLHALPRHGVRKVSMTDVSNEAGMSRGTVYRYFSTKEELLGALGTYVIDQYRLSLKRAIEANPDSERRIGVVIEAIAAFTESRPQLERLTESEPEFVLKFWRDNFDDLLAPIQEAIGPAFVSAQTGRRRPRDLNAVAESILRLALSYQMIPPKGESTPAARVGEVLDGYVQYAVSSPAD